MINEKWIDKKRNEKDFEGWVGEKKQYENIAIIIFNLLKSLNLKQSDKFLDIGCGGLRAGRLLIHYLNENCYHAIEPEKWLVDEAIKKYLTKKYIKDKWVEFDYNNKFDLQCFNKTFDFIMANSIFIHACKSQIEKCFDEVDKVLNEDGKFLFNYFVGESDNENEEWSYPSSIKYTKNYILNLIKKYNFDYKYINCYYPGQQKFILVTRKK